MRPVSSSTSTNYAGQVTVLNSENFDIFYPTNLTLGSRDKPLGFKIIDIDRQTPEVPILLSVDSNNATPPGLDFSGDPAEYAAAWAAKEICTRVFIANGDPQSTLATEVSLIGFAAPGFNPNALELTIDEIQETVTVGHPDQPDRTAVFAESQGCIILPVGVEELAFTPQTIEWLGPPEDALWPLGEVVVEGESPIDKTALDEALDAHIERRGLRGIVVVHQGELVGERYAPGYGAMVPQRAWSTGKSVAATAVGRMIDQGYLELDQPAPVEAWANDERQEITIRNLLNMSSGLDQEFDRSFSAFFTPENEHTFIYVEGFDAVADAVEVPPGAFEPGTEYAYRNANPLIATAIARLAFAEASGQDELDFLAREVFEPLGMRSSFVETDLHGNFLISGAFYTTARDLARLALVHMQDGIFGGEQVLSEEWTNFVYQPSPGLENFGAYWRNNINGALNLPTDAFFASGGFGQRSIAIPSRDLVIAQLAFDPFTDDQNFELFVNEVVDIIDTTTPIIEPEPSNVELVFSSIEEDSNQFYVTSDGDNIFTGEEGADQFWIANAEIPQVLEIPVITEFTTGEDVIGIAGLGIGFDDVSITNLEGDAIIGISGSDIAILRGIDATSLSADDFAFA
ncbi:MAG: serine hydrolase [Cyanobacteria bacterium P01_F01_bin.143]